MAAGECRSLAAWERCPKPVPSAPSWTAQRAGSTLTPNFATVPSEPRQIRSRSHT